jgi:hypothetical protein
LSGKVCSLDYKTLRYPGHYVDKQIKKQALHLQQLKHFNKRCKRRFHIEDDQIVLYAAVEGKDIEGVLRREIAKTIFPSK